MHACEKVQCTWLDNPDSHCTFWKYHQTPYTMHAAMRSFHANVQAQVQQIIAHVCGFCSCRTSLLLPLCSGSGNLNSERDQLKMQEIRTRGSKLTNWLGQEAHVWLMHDEKLRSKPHSWSAHLLARFIIIDVLLQQSHFLRSSPPSPLHLTVRSCPDASSIDIFTCFTTETRKRLPMARRQACTHTRTRTHTHALTLMDSNAITWTTRRKPCVTRKVIPILTFSPAEFAGPHHHLLSTRLSF